jgi:hypothetical protein
MEKSLKKNPDIIWKNIRGESVLLNPMTGKYYGLNKVGCSFWEKIDDSRTLSDIATLMLEEFNVTQETLLKDLDDLMKKLIENNILTLDE